MLHRYFGRTFYALATPSFRTFWWGTLFSFLGMQMQIIARGFLAYELTGSNSALGGLLLAFGIPQLMLGLWGGVVADRLPKRNLLIVAQGIIAANSAWVATMIAVDAIEYWMLLVAGAVQGAGFAFVGPARQAFISDLVGRDSLGNAVVLQQFSMNSTRVIGPSLAGALIALPLFGVAGVYYLTTAGFLVAMLTMIRLPAGNPQPREGMESPARDLLEGLRYVYGRPAIALLILTSFTVIMVGFPYQSFLPSISKDVYGMGSGGLGALSSVGAIGALVATVVVAGFAQHRNAWYFQPVLALAFCATLMLFGVASNFLFGLVAMFALGGMASGFQALNNSLTMSLSEERYLGRVQSIAMMSWSLYGLIAFPIGMVADSIGIQETLVLQGLVAAVAVVLLHLAGRVRNVAADRFPRPVLAR
jgi:MFS family permease